MKRKFSTYQQAMDYLYQQLPFYQRSGGVAYKNNLDNTLKLDEYFHHPHHKFKSIHIAGTNGKGSVSHMLASVLAESGYRTGLYTSPHLLDYRERIRINGEMIAEEAVLQFVNTHWEIFEQLQPSFFEMSVAMAFWYFADKQVDIAIVETGLGGRLDSTNIIIPEVSVITNISLDHVELLGHTIEAIAEEKAGIIKHGIPVVIGRKQSAVMPVFQKRATEKEASLLIASDICHLRRLGDKKQTIKTDHGLEISFTPDLEGPWQPENYITAAAVLEMMLKKSVDISREAIARGFSNVIRNTGLMGRWQVLKQKPLMICDTAHNVEGLSKIISQLVSLPHHQLHMVVGFVNDKNTDAVFELLPPLARYYFTQAAIPRAMPYQELLLRSAKYNFDASGFSTVQKAVDTALAAALPNDVIFVGGSTFVVAEAMALRC